MDESKPRPQVTEMLWLQSRATNLKEPKQIHKEEWDKILLTT